MLTTRYYKYINLLFKISLGIAALWFIVNYLYRNWAEHSSGWMSIKPRYELLLLVLVLVFVNWGVEALKWKWAIRGVQSIDFGRAYSATLAGITASIVTPNRIGEIPFRAIYLANKNRTELTAKTAVSSFSQLMATILMGLIGAFMTYHYFIQHSLTPVICAVLALFCLLIYFRINWLAGIFEGFRWSLMKRLVGGIQSFNTSDLFVLLLYSLVRYGVFVMQYYLVLKAVGVDLTGLQEFMLIPVCFLVASLIPTILLSELGVRGSVALFVFGAVSEAGTAIILASIVLWTMNVILPAILGIPGLKKIKLLVE